MADSRKLLGRLPRSSAHQFFVHDEDDASGRSGAAAGVSGFVELGGPGCGAAAGSGFPNDPAVLALDRHHREARIHHQAV